MKLKKVFEEHIDWVNDIILDEKEGKSNTLNTFFPSLLTFLPSYFSLFLLFSLLFFNWEKVFSCSSDNCVKVWDLEKKECLSTLRHHKDYVKALGYDEGRKRLVSGGVDNTIYYYDLHTEQVITSYKVFAKSECEERASIYSLATPNQRGEGGGGEGSSESNLLLSGSADGVVRGWDFRCPSPSPIFLLQGHSLNIRALLLNSSSTLVPLSLFLSLSFFLSSLSFFLFLSLSFSFFLFLFLFLSLSLSFSFSFFLFLSLSFSLFLSLSFSFFLSLFLSLSLSFSFSFFLFLSLSQSLFNFFFKKL